MISSAEITPSRFGSSRLKWPRAWASRPFSSTASFSRGWVRAYSRLVTFPSSFASTEASVSTSSSTALRMAARTS